MNAEALAETARALVSGNKGLLAMDESTGTCNERFARLGIPQDEETRRAYRELLVTTPGLGQSINGAILCDDLFVRPCHPATGFGDLAGRGVQRVGGAKGAVSPGTVRRSRAPW